MLKALSLLTVAAALTTAASSPAAAYNCSIPAIADQTKRAVCRDLNLRDLDSSERRSYAAITAALGAETRASLQTARTAFYDVRRRCGVDTRCLNVAYRTEIRLYIRLKQCTASRARAACVNEKVSRHRQELHRSL